MSKKADSTLARSLELKNIIEKEIVTGILAPGSKLDEMTLATRFNVSRTPVREALNQLASSGLVSIRPRRGAVVAKVGLKELLDMFEVMAELEGLCGKFAARRFSDSEGRRLREIMEESSSVVKTEKLDEYYEVNMRFHELIYAGSHNQYLADQTLALRNRLTPYRKLQLHRHNRLAESFAEHNTILDALMNRDEDSAYILLRDHVMAQSGSLNDFIANFQLDHLISVNADKRD